MNNRLTVRKIVIAGVLGAISILLGVTRLGFIPVPTAAGNATIMHIPAVIGGILEGWGVGLVIGLIFGVSSFLNATVPLFKDPLVAIIPRLFIGVAAYFTYVGLKRFNQLLAVGLAGFIGSLTNTVLVLLVAVLRGYLSSGVALTIAVTNGIPEAVVSVIVTVAVVGVWKRIGSGRQTSKVSRGVEGEKLDHRRAGD
ncbi:putative membrane protein [Melghirimyces profundicolus]|uniref:Putative membrane protein n=1 Tax=Melghirimyces profundicolus TaxID=1242148 RepID=A0A2T6C8G4_9BACL|nr:ECF transporter S component [Melghirimyces profundicolus]PTX64607.1 putative membrane protein [Melghirimyces profundicolus]